MSKNHCAGIFLVASRYHCANTLTEATNTSRAEVSRSCHSQRRKSTNQERSGVMNLRLLLAVEEAAPPTWHTASRLPKGVSLADLILQG